MRRLLLLLLIAAPLHAGEVQQFGSDVNAMTLAPLHWTKAQWMRFAEGAGTVAAVAIADHAISDFTQDHPSRRLSRIATDDLS